MSDRDELDWLIVNEPWKLTKKEIYDLTKSEQSEILKSKGIKDIPKYEKERVEKIIDIIKGGD